VPDVSVVRDARRRKSGNDQWNAEPDTTFLAIRTGGEGADGVFEERSVRSDAEGIDYESKWATLSFAIQ
jgi:hypothetical protein